MSVDVVDVSHHQTPAWLDVPALARRGVLGVICRATYGKGTADRDFVEFSKRVRGEGMAFGAYLFYRQVHTVEEQLALWDRQLELVGGLQPGDFLPVLDMEENKRNGDGLPNSKLFGEACQRIAEGWLAQYGGVILYYSSYFPEYLKAYGQWMQSTPDLKHWLADYGTKTKASVPGKPRTPYTKLWHLHQYAGDHPPGRIPEYANGTQNIDLNALNPTVAFDELLIRSPDEVSDEAREGEEGTDARPGGADREDVADGVRDVQDGVVSILRGLEKLRRA